MDARTIFGFAYAIGALWFAAVTLHYDRPPEIRFPIDHGGMVIVCLLGLTCKQEELDRYG